MADDDTDQALEKYNRGCATKLVVTGAALLTLIACVILSAFLGPWPLLVGVVTWGGLVGWTRYVRKEP